MVMFPNNELLGYYRLSLRDTSYMKMGLNLMT